MSITLDLWPDERPQHALECILCHQDDVGEWTPIDVHERRHLPVTCAYCGDTEWNRTMFDINHGDDWGGHGPHYGFELEYGFPGCFRMGLCIKRAIGHMQRPAFSRVHDLTEMLARDWALIAQCGFLVTPDGALIRNPTNFETETP